MSIAIECGQKLFSRRAWQGKKWRRITHGVACGPIMFWWKSAA